MSGEDDANGLETIRPEQMDHEDWGRLLRGGSGPGHADVAILGTDPENRRAIGLAVLGGLMTTPEFRLVIVVAPPSRQVAAEIAVRARRILAANGHSEASQRVMHHQMGVLDAAGVTRLAEECGDDALIYVVSAGQFRYADIGRPTGATTTEDVWTHHVARLATELALGMRGTSYALLDVGHTPPVDEKNIAMLGGIPGRVISLTIPNEAAALARAVMDVRADDSASLDTALTAIAASRVDAKASAMLQATALRNAERYVAAFGVIARFWDEWISTADTSVLTQLAQIAVAAGEMTKAREALGKVRIDALSIELTELVLPIARRANARALEESLIDRLKATMPNSEFLSHHLVDRTMGARDWNQLGKLAADPSLNLEESEREFLGALAVTLLDEDLVRSTKRLSQQFAERRAMIHLLAGREATRRHLYPEAIALLSSVSPGTEAALRAASLILDSLELSLFERTKEGGFAIPDDVLSAMVAFVASRVAIAPRDPQLRMKLAQLLSADVIGTRGEALLLFLVERLATSHDQEPAVRTDTASLDEAREFLQLVADMTDGPDSQSVVVLGVGELPPHLTAEAARRLLPILPEALSHMLDDLTDSRSVAAAKLVLHAALLACVRANARHNGILMLRMTAVHLATTGWSQEARDVAEHALNWVRNHPDELRLAWTLFADVYHRLGNLHEALVAMLLAASLQEAKFTCEDAWHETHLMLRVLRDLGLHDEALAMVAKAESLLTKTPRWDARLQSIRLAVELRKHDATERAAPDTSLMERLAANVRQLLELKEDVTPPLLLLMQLIARAAVAEAEVPAALHQLVEAALSSVSPTLAARLKALGDPNADLATVRSLTIRIGDVRNSDDVGYDIQAAALVAQRALSRAERLDGWSVVELIELLTDRTLVSATSVADHGGLHSELDRLLAEGHIVHLLGLDDTGRLVRATLDAGKQPEVRRESLSIFNPSAFKEWKKKYPYQYSKMDGPDSVMGDLVRRSVDQLGISSPAQKITVIVPDVRLSMLPMNLLRQENEFLGAIQPVTSVPSLAWLATRTRQPRATSGRRIAWISDALPAGDESPALGPLAARLEPIATKHGFVFTRSPQIPRDLSRADIAIVTAHGGLLPDARFFQVVRDDASERWSPRSIADAVANAGCVVMFVCSAGRHDEHPRARAVVGLARLLLDREVRVVVASPWPIDTRVPPRWLPAFLEWLDYGEPISDAVHAANLEVSNHFGGNPPHAFAMHLYGDPTYRCPHNPGNLTEGSPQPRP